jgi:hypothetical protein
MEIVLMEIGYSGLGIRDWVLGIGVGLGVAHMHHASHNHSFLLNSNL